MREGQTRAEVGGFKLIYVKYWKKTKKKRGSEGWGELRGAGGQCSHRYSRELPSTYKLNAATAR